MSCQAEPASKFHRLRCVHYCALLLGAMFAVGCDTSNLDKPADVAPPTTQVPAELPKLDWLDSPTSLEHFGSTAGLEQGAVLQRGVTIHTDAGDLVLEDAVATHGPAGDAWKDEKTGQLMWKAQTCINPDCPGRQSHSGPYIFPHVVHGAWLDAEGYVRVKGKQTKLIPKCPACGKTGTVREFMIPEVAKRYTELEEELLVSRAARRNGKSPPPGVRDPMEIMKEQVLLPRLYLPPQ